MEIKPLEPSINFTVKDKDTSEMLKITNDGFYVRGIKLEQDENEAKKVYEAFTTWMKDMGIYKNE